MCARTGIFVSEQRVPNFGKKMEVNPARLPRHHLPHLRPRDPRPRLPAARGAGNEEAGGEVRPSLLEIHRKQVVQDNLILYLSAILVPLQPV